MKKLFKNAICIILSAIMLTCIVPCTVSAQTKDTVYVDVQNVMKGVESFWAWIWSDDTEGHFEPMSVSSNGLYTVDLAVGENVVFTRIRSGEQPDWSLVWNQTEDLQYTGDYNCAVLRYSDIVGGNMTVDWTVTDGVNRALLAQVMKEAAQCIYEDADKYTDETISALESAYYNAQNYYEISDSQEEIDRATQALQTAIDGLIVKGEMVGNAFVKAVRAQYNNNKIQKEDINIEFMSIICKDKYLTKYTVSNYGYTCEMVDIEIGDYVINTARPEPVVYTNGVIYGITDAYEQGVLSDDDLIIMSGFDELDMVKSKITKELQYEMGRYESDDIVNIRFELNEQDADLSHQKLIDTAFADIEYTDLVHNNGISILGVKRGDIEKVADYDLVKKMDYISDTHLKYIGEYDVVLSDYFYEEKCRVFDENGEASYILIKANSGERSDAEIGFRFGNHIIKSNAIYNDFTYGFGIYDLKENNFYDVYDLRETIDKYPKLESTLAFYSKATLAGDCDGDDTISILDATKIQRLIAQLDTPLSGDGYVSHESDGFCYTSDIDNDGQISIIDATTIQRKLAHL